MYLVDKGLIVEIEKPPIGSRKYYISNDDLQKILTGSSKDILTLQLKLGGKEEMVVLVPMGTEVSKGVFRGEPDIEFVFDTQSTSKKRVQFYLEGV